MDRPSFGARPCAIPTRPARAGGSFPPPHRARTAAPPPHNRRAASSFRLAAGALRLREGFRGARNSRSTPCAERLREMAAMVGARRALFAARYSPRGELAAALLSPARRVDSPHRYRTPAPSPWTSLPLPTNHDFIVQWFSPLCELCSLAIETKPHELNTEEFFVQKICRRNLLSPSHNVTGRIHYGTEVFRLELEMADIPNTHTPRHLIISVC